MFREDLGEKQTKSHENLKWFGVSGGEHKKSGIDKNFQFDESVGCGYNNGVVG